MRHYLWRPLSLATIAVAVVLASSGAALATLATPTPDSGPEAGGTTVSVPEPFKVTSVSAGLRHSLALGSNGNIYAWGMGYGGQLGNGSDVDSEVPIQVQTPAGVAFTSISAGIDYSLAIGSDGHTYAWGTNDSGQIGDGTRLNVRDVPVQVQSPAGVTFSGISAGYALSLAIDSDGHTYAWGINDFGQLGDGSNADSSIPIQVQTPAGVTFTSISAGQLHSLAIGSDGNTYAWGRNDSGQLGDGSNANSNVPVRVQSPAGVTFTSISAGESHSLAVGSDGNTYAWGLNANGQLGDGSNTDSNLPVLVQTPAGVTFTSIGGGSYNSVAFGSDGNAYAWGSNYFGQFGNGSNTDSNVPVLVQTPAGVTFTSISGGNNHSLAFGSDGNIYSWGWNSDGQLGDGSRNDSNVPVQVVMDAEVTEVTFDGLPGTNLVDNGDGTWSVDTPAHAPGPVDVIVSWTLNGVAQTPVTYADGFTYIGATPTATPTPSSSATPTATPTPSSSATPTPTTSATAQPVPPTPSPSTTPEGTGAVGSLATTGSQVPTALIWSGILVFAVGATLLIIGRKRRTRSE